MSLLEACGISAASKEATSFAFMGLECILGRPMIVPSIECQDQVICGKITPGRNYGDVLDRVVEFRSLPGKSNGFVNGNGETKANMPASWLPPVRDLRVHGNTTRDKERRDPILAG